MSAVQDFSLSCKYRTLIGTSESRRLRRLHSLVPGILYGGSEASSEAFSCSINELENALKQPDFSSSIVKLHFQAAEDGKSKAGKSVTKDAILKDVQRHPSTMKLLHVDFLAVDVNKEMSVTVPVHFLNESQCAGVRLGRGLLSHHLISVEIIALPTNFPHYVEVSVEHLEVGQSIRLSDLKLPEGVRVKALDGVADSDRDDKNIAIVSVMPPKGGVDAGADDEAEDGGDSE